eukprot:13003618-Alexandrium_andersonii.AAC.1
MNVDLLAPVVPTKLLVTEFRKSFLQYVDEHVHPSDRGIFTGRATGRNLGAQFGFMGYVATLQAWPCVEQSHYDRA